MGELICVCREANIFNCASCGFGKECSPERTWNHPSWPNHLSQDERSGLDELADEIMAGFDEDDIEYLGLNKPQAEEE